LGALTGDVVDVVVVVVTFSRPASASSAGYRSCASNESHVLTQGGLALQMVCS
jgi:hypothetical protein